MLIKDKQAITVDPIMLLIGNSKRSKLLPNGIYLIGHFGSSHFLRNYKHYPEIPHETYDCCGVCDSPEQLLEKIPELVTDPRKFLVTVTEINRDEQPDNGGWRWHKWGEYIGDKEPTMEYLYDESEIEQVYVYHIYEKVNKYAPNKNVSV